MEQDESQSSCRGEKGQTKHNKTMWPVLKSRQNLLEKATPFVIQCIESLESRPYIGQKLCPVVALCGPGFDFAHVQLEELASVSSYSSTLPLVSFHCFVKIFKVALVFSCPKLWDIRHPLAFATIPEDVATLQHLSEGLRNDCEILLHAAALSEQDFGGQDWRLSWSRDGGELKIWNNI